MREKSLQDLREALKTQEDRRRAVEVKARTQERKLEEQVILLQLAHKLPHSL